MKRIIPILLLCSMSFVALSQVKTFSPTGRRISDPTLVNISGVATVTTLFADSIKANNLVLGKYYPFRVDLAVTTPAINLVNLTVTIKYGSQSFVVMNNAALVGGLTNAPITITGYIVSRGMTSQFIPCVISQPSGAVASLTFSNSNVRGLMTVDASATQPFSITAQLGGIGVGSASLLKDWALSQDF